MEEAHESEKLREPEKKTDLALPESLHGELKAEALRRGTTMKAAITEGVRMWLGPSHGKGAAIPVKHQPRKPTSTTPPIVNTEAQDEGNSIQMAADLIEQLHRFTKHIDEVVESLRAQIAAADLRLQGDLEDSESKQEDRGGGSEPVSHHADTAEQRRLLDTILPSVAGFAGGPKESTRDPVRPAKHPRKVVGKPGKQTKTGTS